MSNIGINNNDIEFSDTITNDIDVEIGKITVKDIKDNSDKDEDLTKDILLREAKLLYPEVEDWILKIAIDGYINTIKKHKSQIDEAQ